MSWPSLFLGTSQNDKFGVADQESGYTQVKQTNYECYHNNQITS